MRALHAEVRPRPPNGRNGASVTHRRQKKQNTKKSPCAVEGERRDQGEKMRGQRSNIGTSGGLVSTGRCLEGGVVGVSEGVME